MFLKPQEQWKLLMAIIEVHSAYDPESLVAVGLDLVTITEAARIADLEDVWSNIEGRLNSLVEVWVVKVDEQL